MSQTRVLLVGIIFLLGYGRGEARNINSARKVNLKEVTETNTIIIELDSATITIGLNQAKGIIKKLKSRREFDDQSHQEIFDKTLTYLSEETDYFFEYKPSGMTATLKSEIGWLIVQYALNSTLGNGRAKVFNVGTKKFEQSILCHYYRTQIADEQHEGYDYRFINGKIFLKNPISI
jgi:hypothetical protein